MKQRYLGTNAVSLVAILWLSSGCLRPVCDDAAGSCPHTPDAGTHPPDAGPPSDAGYVPDAGPSGECTLGGSTYPIGASNPEDPSQCCAGTWVSRLQDAGTYPLSARSRVVNIAFADLNRDGPLDLAVSFVEMGVDRPSPQLGIMLARPDGTFGPLVTYEACLSGGLAVGDLNGDGYPDVVTGTCADGSINVFINRADGTGALREGVSLAFQVPLQASSFPLQDFDGDGKLDLVLAGQEAYFLKGLGDGGFADPVGYSFPFPPLGDYSIVAASFQNGGRDFVVGTRSNGALNIFLGTGNASFLAQSTLWNGLSNLGLAAGDFDGDGRTDVALGGSTPENPMSILLGNGGGAFSGQYFYPAAGAGPVALADVDGDGRSEALVATTTPPYAFNVLWHFPDGGTTVTTSPLEQLPGCIVARDLKNDFSPDVAIGTGSTVQLYTDACTANHTQAQPQPGVKAPTSGDR
jgi:FG-GAP-like repeat